MTCPAASLLGPVHRFPQIAAALPPSLAWLSAPPDAGFSGQWARLSVLVESVQLADDAAGQGSYRVELRLPRSDLALATPTARPSQCASLDPSLRRTRSTH